jgi:hypothetical protein
VADEGEIVASHMPTVAVSQKAGEKTRLPKLKRLETPSHVVAKSRIAK